MEKNDIEQLINQIKEAVQEFQGGPRMRVRVIGHMNKQKVMTPFGGPVDADFDVNDKLKADDKPDCEIYAHPYTRVIKKGYIDTAWQRGSTTVLRLGMEEIIINETLDKFCDRVGWPMNCIS